MESIYTFLLLFLEYHRDLQNFIQKDTAVTRNNTCGNILREYDGRQNGFPTH